MKDAASTPPDASPGQWVSPLSDRRLSLYGSLAALGLLCGMLDGIDPALQLVALALLVAGVVGTGLLLMVKDAPHDRLEAFRAWRLRNEHGQLAPRTGLWQLTVLALGVVAALSMLAPGTRWWFYASNGLKWVEASVFATGLLGLCAAVFTAAGWARQPLITRLGHPASSRAVATASAVGVALLWFAAPVVAWWALSQALAWGPPKGLEGLRPWLAWALPLAYGAAVLVFKGYRHLLFTGWLHQLEAGALRADAADQARRLAEGQLAMMQAQIEPHFLYNTLASVQYLVRKDSTAADFLLTQLIRYLRHAMPRMRKPMSTLAQEFELADAYLQIARMRMGGRLSVEVELPQTLHELAFPPLVLQTLVENAIKHGVEPKVGPVRISLDASVHQGELRIRVEDDGVGLGKAPTAGSGTGLANIRERLAGIYGDRARLEVRQSPGGGVLACVGLLGPFALPEPAHDDAARHT